MKRQVDIERLLSWAFLDELPKGGSEAWSPWDRIATLGTRIDDQFGALSRLPPIFGDPHPDALIVARYVGKLYSPARELVTHYAILNSRPCPLGHAVRVFPVRDGSRIRVVGKSYGRASNGKWRYYTEGSHCPLRFEPTVEEVAQSRADWTAWLTGLQELVLGLRGHLSEHWPVGPRWPLEPWNEPQPIARVLYA